MSCIIEYKGKAYPLDDFFDSIDNILKHDLSPKKSNISAHNNNIEDLKTKEFTLDGVDLQEDYSFIKGVPTNLQYNIINNIVTSIVNSALNEDNIVSSQLAVKSILNVIETRRGFVEKLNSPNRDKILNVIDTILDNEDLILKRVNKVLSTSKFLEKGDSKDIETLKQTYTEENNTTEKGLEENENELNKEGIEDSNEINNFDDNSIFKANPIDKLSIKNRALLGNIRNGKIAVDENNKPILDEKGNYILKPDINIISGLENYVPIEQVYMTLLSLFSTTNSQYVPQNFDNFERIIKDNIKVKPYLIDVLDAFKKASDSQKMAFISNFANQYSHPSFVNAKRMGDGSIEYRTTNSDSRDIANSSIASWTNEMYLNGSLTNSKGKLAVKDTIKDFLKDQAKYISALHTVPKSEVDKFFKPLGIKISDSVYNALVINGINNTTLQDAFNANNYGIFGLMADLVSINDNIEDNSIFNDGVFTKLAKYIAEYSETSTVSSFRSILGDMHYAYTKPRTIIDNLAKAKNDIQYLVDRIDTPFSAITKSTVNKASFMVGSWLKNLVTLDSNGNYVIDTESSFYKNLEYSSPEGLKTIYNRGKEFKRLNKFEYETTKVNIFFNNNKSANGKPIYGFIGLTMSDKSNPVVIKSEGIEVSLGYDKDGNPRMKGDRTIETGTGTHTNKGDISTMYEAIILPEVNRMLTHRNMIQNGQVTNVDGFDKGGNTFYMFPTLNKIDYLFEIGPDAGMIHTKTIRPDILTNPKAKALIYEAINTELINEINSKKLKWLDLGIISDNLNDTFDIKGFNTTVEKGITLKDLDNLIYNYIYNYKLANANMQQLLIGDPTIFYQAKGLKEIKDSIDKIKNKETLTEEDNIKLSKLEHEYNDYLKTGLVKESFDNQGKRLASDNASGSPIPTENPNFKLWIMPDVKKDSSILDYLSTLLGEKELKNYKGINTTDAQEYTTLKEHLRWLMAEDKISKETMDELNYLYDNDLPIDWKAFEEKGVVLVPVKPIYKNNFVRNDGDIPLLSRLYVKSSSVPLIKGFTKNQGLDKIRQYMEDNDIDRAAYESAVKVGLPSKEVLAKGDFVIEVPRDGHLRQQDIPFHDHNIYKNDGTQKSNLLYVNLMDVEGFVDPITKETVNGRKHYEGYIKQYNDLFRYKYMNLLKSLDYDTKTKRLDFNKLSTILQKEALDRGFSENEILQLQLDKDGNFRVPLWLSNNDGKLQALLNSIVDNRIRKRKTRGYPYVLLSDNGIGNSRYGNDIVWVNEPVEELKPIRLNTENGEVVGGQILVPFDVFDQDNNRLDILDYATKLPNGKLVIDTTKVESSILEAFGYRIPTQDMGSMHIFEIVGFLPSYMKDSIIAPKELVAQMGGDFDVDKLYTYLFNIFKDPETGNLHKITEDNYKELGNRVKKDFTQQKLENNILEYSLAVMKNPDKTVQKQIYTPIDNAEYIRGLELAEELSKINISEDYNYFSEEFQTYKYQNAVVGKDAVGAFALDTVFNAVAQTVKDGINHVFTNEKGSTVIYPYLGDIKGNRINNPKTLDNVTNKSDVIKALLSMAVDNEKLQVLGTLNINNGTFDFIRGAVFGGFNIEQIVTFLNHPSIKKYVSETSINKTNYIDNLYQTDSAIPLEDKDISVYTFEDIKNALKLPVENISDKEALQIIKQFRNVERMGRNIKVIQSATNSDSAGIGKNIFESSIKQDKILSLVDLPITNAEKIIGDFKDLDNIPEYTNGSKEEKIAFIKKLEDDGFININTSVDLSSEGVYRDRKLVYIKPNTIKGFASVYGTIFNNQLWDNVLPYNKFKFKLITAGITSQLNRFTKDRLLASTSDSAKFNKDIADNLKSYLFSYNSLLSGGFDNIYELRKNLLIDSPNNTSLGTFLHTLKSKNTISNRLLSRLNVIINDTSARFGDVNTINYNAATAESVDEDLIVQAIIDLLENKNVIGTRNGKDVTGFDLARDLINYQMITGGIQKANQFIKHIPVKYYESLGVYDTSVQNYKGLNNINGFITQFIQHNPEFFAKRFSHPLLGSPILDTSTFEDDSIFTFKDIVVLQSDDNAMYIYKRESDTSDRFIRLDNLSVKGLKEYDFTNVVGKSTQYAQQGDHLTIDSIFNAGEVTNESLNNLQRSFNINSSNIVPFTLRNNNTENGISVGSIVDDGSGSEFVVINKDGDDIRLYAPNEVRIFDSNIDNYNKVGEYTISTDNDIDYIVTDSGHLYDLTNKTIFNGTEIEKQQILKSVYSSHLPTVELPTVRNSKRISNLLTSNIATDEFDAVIKDPDTESIEKRFNLETGNIKHILHATANNLDNPITRYVAQQLLANSNTLNHLNIITDYNLNAKGKVIYDVDGTSAVSIRINPNNVENSEDLAKVITEEILHAVTAHSLSVNPEINTRVNELYSKIKDLVLKKYKSEYDDMVKKLENGLPLSKGREYDLLYSVYNVQEFLNAAINNKSFQETLNKINTDKLKSKSLWQSFVDTILEVLARLGIVKNSALELAVHETLNLIDKVDTKELNDTKKLLSERGYTISTKEAVQENFGLTDGKGNMIPIGNAYEVADFINMYAGNLIAINEGPYVFVDYIDNINLDKYNSVSFDDVVYHSKLANKTLKGFQVGETIQYKNGKYKILGLDSSGKVLLRALDDSTKLKGKINVNEISKLVPTENNNINEDTNKAVNTLDSYSNFSGGAKGADLAWDSIGREFGINNHTHYTNDSYDKLPDEERYKIDEQYIATARFLKRSILYPNSYAGKLVRRDMLQANSADSIYGVTELILPGKKGRKGYVNKNTYITPEGGTAYAIARGILSTKPTYVYNQSSEYGVPKGWYMWDINTYNFVAIDTPTLSKNYAGIGTTSINEDGLSAIRDVYNKTLNSDVQANPITGQTKMGLSPTTVSDSDIEWDIANTVDDGVAEETAMDINNIHVEGMTDDQYKEYLESSKYKNKLYLQTLKDRSHDLQKIVNSIRDERPTTPEELNDKHSRLYKAYGELNDLQSLKEAINSGIYSKDEIPLSTNLLYNRGVAELQDVERLLTQPLTSTHLTYAKRIADFWSRSRDILFDSIDRNDKYINNLYLKLEDDADRLKDRIMSIVKESTNKALKETLNRDITVDDIMHEYIPKNQITAQFSDLSTMGNDLLSHASITIKNTEIETREELEHMFKDFDELVTKGYRKLKNLSKNGSPYDIFMQKKPNGKESHHLVKRYSYTFQTELRKATNEFYKTGRDFHAVSDLSNWVNNNTEHIDLKSIFPINGVITEEVSKARQELMFKLGVNAYNEYMTAQGEKLDMYNLNKQGMELALEGEFNVKIEDVKNHIKNKTEGVVESLDMSNAISAFKRWVTTHNPYIFNRIDKTSTRYSKYNNFDYVEIVPTLSNPNYYDNAFKEIEKDEDIYNMYKMFNSTYNKLNSYLTPEQRRDITYNGLVEIENSVFEQYMDKGFKLGLRPILDAFRQNNSSTEPFVHIDIASGKEENRMHLGFSRKLRKDIDLELETRTYKYLIENGQKPSAEQLQEWEEELVDNISDYTTPDLGKHLKIYAAAVVAFKNKSKIEDSLKMVRQVMDDYIQVLRDSKGRPLKDNNGTIKRKATPEESFVNEKKVYDYSIGKLIYNTPNDRTLGEKIYTTKDKQQVEEIDKSIDRIKKYQKGDLSKEDIKFYQPFVNYLVKNHITANDVIAQLERRKAAIGKYIDYSKVGQTILQYVQLKGMGWNIPGGISNVIFGAISNIIEGSNGQVYNNSDLLKGYRLAMHSVARNLSFNTYNGKDREAIKIRMAMDKLDILKESSAEFQGSSYVNPVYKKAKFLAPYNVNQRGEYLNQAPLLLAIATKTKVTVKDGQVISIWDGFDSNFEWQTEKYGEMPKKAIDRMKLKVDQIIKSTHGNYDPTSPIMAKKTILGRALLQFRTWMVDSYRVRFGDVNGRYDPILEVTRKGRYISFFDAVKANPGKTTLAILSELAKKFVPNISSLSGVRNNLKLESKLQGIEGIEAHDIANLQAVVTEIAMALSIYALLLGSAALVGDLDDEEVMVYNFWRNQATRARTDILLYVNPLEMRKLTKDPLPFIGIIDDIKSLTEATYDLLSGNDEYTTGVYRGESKFAHKSLNAVPLVSGLYRGYKSASQTFDK